mgnify:CR=1 FL=1
MSKKLETLGLVEVTSQRQADNGTVCFHDPITNCDYLSYESGYIRRSYTRNYKNYKGYEWSHRTIYQLNPTKKSTYEWNGKTWPSTERIMIHDPNYRLELLTRAVVNYRKNQSK